MTLFGAGAVSAEGERGIDTDPFAVENTKIWLEQSADALLGAGLSRLADELYGELLEDTAISGEARDRLWINRAVGAIQRRSFSSAMGFLDEVSEDGREDRFLVYYSLARYGAEGAAVLPEVGEGLLEVQSAALPEEDRIWYFFLRSLVADAAEEGDGSRAALDAARELAIGRGQKALFEGLLLREELVRGEADEGTVVSLQQRLEGLRGERASFPFAKQLAVLLYRLERTEEAVAVIDQQLAGGQDYGSREIEQLILLKAMILGVNGVDGAAGRATLRELIRGGRNRDALSVGLQALAAQATASDDSMEELSGFLDELVTRSEAHILLGEIYLLRAQIALAQGNLSLAESDAQRILDQFPGLVRINDVYRLLAYIALQRDPPQYRTAASFLIQLREQATLPEERTRLGLLIGDAYFANGDYSNAVEFYTLVHQERWEADEAGEVFLRLVTAKLRAGMLGEVLTLVEREDNRADVDEDARWNAEWNIVRTLTVDGRVEEALARVRTLLSEGEARQSRNALILRLRWLEARLSMQTGRLDTLDTRLAGLMDDLSDDGGWAEAVSEEERRAVWQEVLLLMGEVQVRLEMPEAAFATFEDLRERFPRSRSADRSFFLEAAHYQRIGRVSTAQRRLQALPEAHPQSRLAPQALFDASMLSLQLGEESILDAVRLLGEMVDQYPDSPLVFEARLQQADFLRRLNDFPSARAVYDALIVAEPNHPRRYVAELGRTDVMVALARQDTTRLVIAGESLERIADIQGLPVERQIEVLLKRAEILRQLENAGEADALFGLIVSRYLLERSEADLARLTTTGRYWLARAVVSLGRLREERGDISGARAAYRLVEQYDLPGQRLARNRRDALASRDN